MKQVTIAQAKDTLPALIHEVEAHGPAEVTRRGQPVAVLLCAEEYARLRAERPDFLEGYRRWREGYNVAEFDIDPDAFNSGGESDL